MSKKKIIITSIVGGMLFAATSAIALNWYKEKKSQPDEYIPELNAYYGGEITDEAGYIKAHKFTTPTDNKYNSQKTRFIGTSLIGDIESVWSSYTGRGTTVAIIDDGFDVNHPEYVRKDGTSAILSTSRYYYASGGSYKYKKYSDDPTCIEEDWEETSDGYEWASHGTATSTTAAAPMNNGGGVGIAPDADILALKIDFSFAAIEGAILYAISQGVDVINMSLGAYAESFVDGWGDSQSGSSSTATYLNSVCQQAYNAGIIVVAAAGNESTWHKSYPACNTKVIGVGATGDWDNKGNASVLAEFTNYVKSNQTGEINVDILAPGYSYTAHKQGTENSPTHTYDDTQGTSFSSPIVAGAACLWKQKYPDGTPDEFLEQLQSSADGIGSYTNQYIPVSGWDSSLSDVGPSNITNGRLNVARLMAVNDPFVSTVQSNLSISVGEKRQIDLDTYNGTISYSSSNTNIATVTNSGLVEGTGAGDATITVTATKNAQTATATVNVHVESVVAATSLSFNPNSVTLSVGDTYNAEEIITLTPNNASRIFLFESTNTSVATVDEDTGLVTAVGVGTTDINVIAGYGNGDDTLSVTVEAAATITDTLTRADTGIASGSTTYSSWSDVQKSGSAVYAGQSAGGYDSIQLRSNNNNSGIVTTASGGNISSVSVTWESNTADGRVLNVYGKNSAYSSPSDLYGNNSGTLLGTIVNGTSTSLNITGNYTYVGVCSSSGALYLSSISFTWGGSGGSSSPTVTSVTVSPSSLSLDLNGSTSGHLSATVNGTNSPAQTVTWISGNSTVATVNSSGVVTAVGVGSTTITATSTVDLLKSGSCTVTVTDSTPKTLSSISISGYKTAFAVNDTFSFGGTVTANFSNSTSDDVTASATFSGYNMAVAGNYTVTVSYTYGGTTKTATYGITVSSNTPVSGDPVTVTYTITSKTAAQVSDGTAPDDSSVSFSNTGTTSTIDQITNGRSENWTLSGYNGLTITNVDVKLKRSSNGGPGTISLTNNGSSVGLDISTTNSTIITQSYGYKAVYDDESGFECNGDLVLTINATASSLYCDSIKVTYINDTSSKIIASLSASYSGGDVYVGGSLDTSKVSVTATYTDSVKYPNAVLSSSDYELSGFSSATAGQKTVTVTYIGSLNTSTTPLTTTFSVTVIVDTITSVSVACTKTFHPGETILKSDITVTEHYQSGAEVIINDFTFANDGYQFTYSDANSGGSNTSKQFSITYNAEVYNFNVNVTRVAYQTINNVQKDLTGTMGETAGITGTSAGTKANYNSLTIGDFTCSATNIYVYNTGGVKYFSFGKDDGELKNTVATSTPIKSLSIYQRASSARSDEKLYVSTIGNTWV